MKKLLYLLLLIPLTGFGQKPVIIAHRGGSGMAPENTLAAFNKAVEVNADFFELDVMISSDDSLVIMHDATVDRTTDGTGNVSSLSYQQLRQLDAGSWFSPEFTGEKIPTLKESLMVAKNSPNNIGVVIEIKSSAASVPAKVVALVQELGMQSRVLVSSFSLTQITEVKNLDPTIPVQLFGTITQANIDQVVAINGDWVGSGGTITQALVDYAHMQGIMFNAWTLNAASTMLPAISLGVDGITTDYPVLLANLMDDTEPGDVVLTSATPSETRVNLVWEAAVDEESGIAGYDIFRDVNPDATTLLVSVGNVTQYTDDTYTESHPYYYRIKARNQAGLSSINYSNEIGVVTLTDITPPVLSAITSRGDSTTVVVSFSERMDKITAEAPGNYTINNGATVSQAILAKDMKSVILKTSPLSERSYLMTVKNVKDRASTPNPIVTVSRIFLHQGIPAGAVAFYKLDSLYQPGLDKLVTDETENHNDGIVLNGAYTAQGKLGNALAFDGIDDFVQFASSPSFDINASAVTVSLWTKPAYAPSNLPGAYGPLFDSETDNYVLYEDRGNNELRFKVVTSSSAERPGIPSADIQAGEWNHVVGVYDGSQAMIYLNGVKKDSHPLTGTVKTGQIATLGKTGTVYFEGSIDQVEIYNRALSQEEITAMYNGITVPPIALNPGNVELASPEVNGSDINLSWSGAINYESILMGYEIYRDENPEPVTLYATVGNVTEFTDHTNAENKDFYYRVKAKNTRGLLSPDFSNEVSATTSTDHNRPVVLYATSRGDDPWTILEFDEKVDISEADIQFDGGITTNEYRLSVDGKKVMVSTAPLAEQDYIITINGVKDLAAIPNFVLPDTKIRLSHQAESQEMIAHYKMKELGYTETDTLLYDETTNLNNGLVKKGASLDGGLLCNSIQFDNTKKQFVQFASSPSFDVNDTMVSISVWTKLRYLPVEMPEAYGPLFDSNGDEYVIYADKGNKELRFKVVTSAKAERPGIPNDDLVTGQWINVFAVYDGSNAKIYLNGVLKDTHPITGTVKAGTIPMLGKSGTTGTPAFFNGHIDNVQVFKAAFTQEEIMEMYENYRMQAVFECESYNLTEDVSICKGETYTFPDGNTASEATDHTSMLLSMYGCDSIITTHLLINEVDVSLTENEGTLTANVAGAGYRWLDCDDSYSVIEGASGQAFTALLTGNYAVEITENGCTDTSECVHVIISGLEDVKKDFFGIYPNPNNGQFSLLIPELRGEAHIELIHYTGKIVMESRLKAAGLYSFELPSPSPGIYILRVTDGPVISEKRMIIIQ